MGNTNDGLGSTRGQERYRRLRSDVARLLDWLELELQKQAEYARKAPDDTTPVELLREVRRDLIRALACLAQTDEQDIEELLAEAAAGKGHS